MMCSALVFASWTYRLTVSFYVQLNGVTPNMYCFKSTHQQNQHMRSEEYSIPARPLVSVWRTHLLISIAEHSNRCLNTGIVYRRS